MLTAPYVSQSKIGSYHQNEKIPYFGEIMESTLLCHECGYKHADTICVEKKEPVKYTLTVEKENLNARV